VVDCVTQSLGTKTVEVVEESPTQQRPFVAWPSGQKLLCTTTTWGAGASVLVRRDRGARIPSAWWLGIA
jgi:hypothetical protein